MGQSDRQLRPVARVADALGRARFVRTEAGPIEVEGEVIWVNPYRPGDRENLHPGMGVKFVDMTGEQRDQIRDLVRTFAYLGDDDADDGVKQ